MPPPDSASPYAAALRSKGPELAGPRARTRATWTADQSPAVLWDTVRNAGSVSGERERRTGGNSGLHDVSLKTTARQSATTAPNNASVGSTASSIAPGPLPARESICTCPDRGASLYAVRGRRYRRAAGNLSDRAGDARQEQPAALR